MARREDVTRRWLAVAVALTLAGVACSDDDDTAPGVEERDVLEVETDADAPVCMQVDENQQAEVEQLPIIDCADPHSHEIFATVESLEEVFPGKEALEDFAEAKCLTAFESFVGTSVFDSELSYTWLIPTLAGWTNEDDREVLCLLMNRDGSPLVGTMRDAQV